MKKTTKNERVLKYSAMASAFLATGAVNSQIIYTDVNPDQVVDQASGPFMLDLDGDATNDAGFQVQFASGTYASVINYSGFYALASAANGMVNATGTNSYAAMLSSGSAISAGNMGTGSTGMLGAVVNYTGAASGQIAAGNFLGNSDGFLGIAFDISGATHYGWVRLDVDAGATTITIKDHAYNTVADAPLNAGEDGLGLNDVPLDSKVNFKPMLDKALINVTPDLFGSTISLVDMSGRELSSTKINDVNTTVEYNGANAGIYMIVVKAEAGTVSKKVYVR